MIFGTVPVRALPDVRRQHGAQLAAVGRLRHLMRPPPSEDSVLAVAMHAVSTPELVTALRKKIQRRVGVPAVALHCSNREALREIAERTGRNKAIAPTCRCFFVPAAVAAALGVRLVDVDLTGRIEVTALRGLPLEQAAAVLVSNPVRHPRSAERDPDAGARRGVAVIDDAIHPFGACSPEGPVGERRDRGILSFGRGKPLSGLGRGAIASSRVPQEVGDELPRPEFGRALVRAAVHDLAFRPLVFRWLTSDSGLPRG